MLNRKLLNLLKLFSFFSVFLSLIPTCAYSQDVNINIGARLLGPIPVLMGELEYDFSGQSIRAGYFSNFKFELFGSSKYEGVSVEYSFNEIKKSSRSSKNYISIGNAEKRNGSSYDENYRFIEIGYEKRYIKKHKGFLNAKHFFMRFYLSFVDEKELPPSITPNDDHVLPGLSMGLGF